MAASEGDFERTIGLAESALERIKALRHPATPHNFEVWYTYAAGINPTLNQAINALIGANGTITEAQAEEIYLKYFSATEIGERIDKVGTQIAGEIEQVMAMIEASIIAMTCSISPAICVPTLSIRSPISAAEKYFR